MVTKAPGMFTPQEYRAKAAEYGELVRTSAGADEKREFERLERSFAVLADNEQWLAENRSKIMHAPKTDRDGGERLAADEEHILRYLGAALIMQWNTLPTKLQKAIFDNAGAMGELLETGALRVEIARFLHKHKNGNGTAEK